MDERVEERIESEAVEAVEDAAAGAVNELESEEAALGAVFERGEAEKTADAAGERDFEAEVRELGERFPEFFENGGVLPQEVTQLCVAGKRLSDAFAEYSARRSAGQARIARQNAESAQRAPVAGVGGSGGVGGVVDEFLRGLMEG